MKRKLCFFGTVLALVLGLSNANAAGNVKISMSCPNAAKPNSKIVCKVYGSRTGSEIDSVEEINVKPTGSLKSASYLIDYTLVSEGAQKNIGTVTVNTGSAGTGYITLVFDAIHFADETFQAKTSVTKKIVVNSSGAVTKHNTVVSGDATNRSGNTNNQNSNNNNTSVNNGDTYLKGIKLSRGILTPAFSKNIYSYSVKVDSDVDKISIDGIKNNVNQVINGEEVGAPLSYGKNVFKLVVSNGNSSKRTYEILITRADDRDTNAKLSSMSLSNGSIKFSPDVYEYETKVLYDVNQISVLATPEKSTSTVTVVGDKNLKVGENIVVITVKSEKGNELKYKIKVTRLNQGEAIGDNANIKRISIAGYNLNFDYSKQSYKLLIKRDSQLNITVEMDDPNATYQILGNSNLKDGSVISIVTKSHDETATQTYTIEITKTKYTIYYVAAVSLVVLVITLPILFYFKYVKPKKQLVDINGNKITKEDLYNDNLRKKLDTTIPNSEEKSVITDVPKINNQTVVNSQAEAPKYAVNIEEPAVLNDNTSNVNMTSSKCPRCGRELLGTPSICPYCNTKLK